ncbi:MAG: hypothetical protein PHG63_01685 [Candidatus Dojkabacteria bacterium]|nr:hypothetical protein [Candidatus Dojkabacteria bacterium]
MDHKTLAKRGGFSSDEVWGGHLFILDGDEERIIGNRFTGYSENLACPPVDMVADGDPGDRDPGADEFLNVFGLAVRASQIVGVWVVDPLADSTS